MAVIALTLAPALSVALTLALASEGALVTLTNPAPGAAPHTLTLAAAGPVVLAAVAELLRGPKGEPGAAGPAGSAGPVYLAAPPIGFSFGDASPRVFPAADAARLVLSVSVNIVTPFDGVAPSLRLGTLEQPELLVAAAQIDLGSTTEFEFSPNRVLAAAQGFVLTLAPGAGATQGSGWIVIEQIPAT